MTKLYDITKDYIGFLESDLPEESLNECLESIEDAFEDKGKNIAMVVSTLQGDVDVIDSHIKRLQDKKKAIKANQERLKDYLRYNMEQTGITKIDHPLFNISIRKPQNAVSVIDADLIPDEYINIKTEIKPDLNAIKKAIKSGETIEGVELVDGKSSITIK